MFQICISFTYVTKKPLLVSRHSDKLKYYFKVFSGYNEQLSRYIEYDFLVATLWLAEFEIVKIRCI